MEQVSVVNSLACARLQQQISKIENENASHEAKEETCESSTAEGVWAVSSKKNASVHAEFSLEDHPFFCSVKNIGQP